MTWPEGRKTVDYLIERNRLEKLLADTAEPGFEAIFERAEARMITARGALGVPDSTGAYAVAYDAYRMAGESLLARQALRATGGEGSHMTVEDAVAAQFAASITAFAKPTFEQFRRKRHTAQYFDIDAPPITQADAEWAVATAEAALDGVRMLIGSNPPDLFE